MIKFICWGPNETITANDRKEAIKMIHKKIFDKYNNVMVCLPNEENVNLQSPRAKEYFGIKR